MSVVVIRGRDTLVTQGYGTADLENGVAATPALPACWRSATVRQFLNHTSGVPSYTDIGPRWLR